MSPLPRKRNSTGKRLDLFKFVDDMQEILMFFSSMQSVGLELTKDMQDTLCKNTWSVFLGLGD